MNRVTLRWIGLASLAAALAVGPIATPPARVGAVARPGPSPRARPGLGATPKPQFQVGNRAISINPHEPGVRAVRAMPPQAYNRAARGQAVRDFYSRQPAAKPAGKLTAAVRAVGPFRREFVWWAYGWPARDRAWWAWNNYAYFDRALWDEWMLDREFAALIAGYRDAHRPQVQGFVPEQYAASPAEAIYSDDYIEAVYNPVYTTPSIVVDGSAGGRLVNLVEGVARVVGPQGQPIGRVGDHAAGLQFVSVPAGFDPTYQIEVKRDGELFVFGPRKTPLADGLGADAVRWHPVQNLIAGAGVDVVYQRHVVAGDKIRLHGVEWSIASEQIELFAPASREALAAARHVARDLEVMAGNKSAFVVANPSLGDYVQEAHDAAARLVTASRNVDADAVDDCHYELAHLRKSSEADLGPSADPALAAAGRDFVRRVRSLQDSLNEVDDLRDPDAAVPAGAGPETEAGGVATAVAEVARPAGRTIDLMKLVNPSKDGVNGTWYFGDGVLKCLGEKWNEVSFPYAPPAEYDFKIVFVRTDGESGLDQLFVGGNTRANWVIGNESVNAVFGPFGPRTPTRQAVASTLRTRDRWIVNGQRYTSVLKVRRDGVESFLDGQPISSWKTDFANLNSVGWPRGKQGTIGVGFGGALSAFRVESAEVTEISGQGRSLRGDLEEAVEKRRA